MKRITVITPANGVWTLPKQPFHRCLLLANLTGVSSLYSFAALETKIQDAAGNIIWQAIVSFNSGTGSNLTFSVQGCETDTSGLSGINDYWGLPLPDDLTIPANLVFSMTLANWSSSDTTPNLIVTTDDPFLDGARPFDDLQAP